MATPIVGQTWDIVLVSRYVDVELHAGHAGCCELDPRPAQMGPGCGRVTARHRPSSTRCGVAPSGRGHMAREATSPRVQPTGRVGPEPRAGTALLVARQRKRRFVRARS
jgi:hypothetical protein